MLFRSQQRTQLLGPSNALWNLSPAGTWQTYAADSHTQTRMPIEDSAPQFLRLTLQQCSDLELITPLNAAMRACAEMWQEHLDEVRARETAIAALRRAHTMGFDDKRDLAMFAEKALTVHPQFDSHPLIARRLGSRQNGDYFSALIDDLSDSDWTLVAG